MKDPTLLLIQELTHLNSHESICPKEVIEEMQDMGFYKGKSFTFVGVYYSYSTDITVIGYPKYMPKYPDEIKLEEVIQHVNLVCRVIEQAKNTLDKSLVDGSNEFHGYINQTDKDYVNKYSLASFIMQDYLNYGVYFNKMKKNSTTTNRNINWQRTIDYISPILDRDVLYLETIGTEYKADYSQLLTNLHIWIINCCSKFLKGLGQYKDVELPEITQSFQNDELRQYIPYLQKKLANVYSNREVQLLKSLMTWCGQSVFYQNQMGITTFDKVWEFATNKVFGNVSNTRSGAPIYCIDGERYKATGESIPDILRVFTDKDKQQRCIGILDAKYRCPIINKNDKEIYGAPPDSEISKQIGYYIYLKNKYERNNIKFTNAFLFPLYDLKYENLYQKLGHVLKNDEIDAEIESLLCEMYQETEVKSEKVLLYQVNSTLLYEYCLSDSKLDNESFYADFIVPF